MNTAARQASSAVTAVIPARGGSKGIPGKNITPIGGVPLVARAVRACLAAEHVTRTVVSTDDPAIAAVAIAAGAEVVERPAELAADQSSSESALLHALDTLEERHGEPVGVLVFVQCTSPFITTREVDETVLAITRDGADSAFTAVPFHGFVWRTSPDGAPAGHSADGVNHDKAFRQRRQDRHPEYLETGTVYAMRVDGFREHGHRFFGRTQLVPTAPERAIELDEPGDLDRARALAPLLDAADLPGRADIDAVVLDFDGTQTDDRVWIDETGREMVAAHRGDGMGIARLRKAGIPVFILSSERNPVVAARARKLGVEVVHGVETKDVELAKWYGDAGIDPQRILYVGNDVNDLPCFELVGWPVAVGDAHRGVRERARSVTSAHGGHGAVREIAEWILGKEL
ncbi:cytidylyltransferase domain-containing protein [Streptomyces sp. NPDC048603]|uniref:cytidylyltransferase domain-containing protein n=1 Tax=Streptomyces sp. NPDC048603 TaxID=3365577 RepID=UPI00371C67CD